MPISVPEREDALARARRGERLSVVGRHGKSRVLLDLADELEGSVVVRVPPGPDQVPYVILHAAAACGAAALRDVAQRLATSVEAAIEKLDHLFSGRPLLVDDADAIGLRGLDPELRYALSESTRCLRDFVERRARVVTSTVESPSARPRMAIHPQPAAEAELRAIWERVDHDVDTFDLAVLRRNLAPGPSEDELADQGWDPAEIVTDVWSALPDALQDVVGILAVHGRPIDESDFRSSSVVDGIALDKAASAGVVSSRRGALWLPKPWYEHCALVVGRGRSRALRARLARAFAGQALGQDAHLAKPLLVLEAHRHYALLGDVERAREFAHFGAATMLYTARQLSLAGRDEDRLYAEAAKTYDVVLQLEKQVQERKGSLGRLVVGYATHYKHYNRYKARLESRVETLDGYRRALDLWPENALFHSRTIAALFLDEKYEEAQRQIEKAYQCVPKHGRRDAVLRGRTADKLLHRERIEPALLVWNDYQPDAWAFLSHERLFASLERGFETRRMRSFDGTLVLNEPTHVRFSRRSKEWLAHALDTSALGACPAVAYTKLIASLRGEVQHLHRTLTQRLSPGDRMRKQRLLGIVDLAASALLDLGDGTTWVYGRLTNEDGVIVFVTDAEHAYEVVPDLSENATGESSYRLARVKTGQAGEPVGPVIELEAPLGDDPARAFERWRERVANDG